MIYLIINLESGDVLYKSSDVNRLWARLAAYDVVQGWTVSGQLIEYEDSDYEAI